MDVLFTLLSSITFIFYGVTCLTTNHMKSEFERYGLAKYRRLTGVLELLGGLGLIAGLQIRMILMISSAGLGFLMLLGTLTRIKAKDSVVDTLPAVSLMLINFIILYWSLI
jgi:uncharacterized membrane protein YphA (DoxX/SURF4 family)